MPNRRRSQYRNFERSKDARIILRENIGPICIALVALTLVGLATYSTSQPQTEYNNTFIKIQKMTAVAETAFAFQDMERTRSTPFPSTSAQPTEQTALTATIEPTVESEPIQNYSGLPAIAAAAMKQPSDLGMCLQFTESVYLNAGIPITSIMHGLKGISWKDWPSDNMGGSAVKGDFTAQRLAEIDPETWKYIPQNKLKPTDLVPGVVIFFKPNSTITAIDNFTLAIPDAGHVFPIGSINENLVYEPNNIKWFTKETLINDALGILIYKKPLQSASTQSLYRNSLHTVLVSSNYRHGPHRLSSNARQARRKTTIYLT
ncbi:MAG: hypothetical protein WCP97_08885 [bacterium]